jgi:hypothetical protein
MAAQSLSDLIFSNNSFVFERTPFSGKKELFLTPKIPKTWLYSNLVHLDYLARAEAWQRHIITHHSVTRSEPGSKIINPHQALWSRL